MQIPLVIFVCSKQTRERLADGFEEDDSALPSFHQQEFLYLNYPKIYARTPTHKIAQHIGSDIQPDTVFNSIIWQNPSHATKNFRSDAIRKK